MLKMKSRHVAGTVTKKKKSKFIFAFHLLSNDDEIRVGCVGGGGGAIFSLGIRESKLKKMENMNQHFFFILYKRKTVGSTVRKMC